MGLTAYRAKRLLLAPRAAYRRARSRDLDPYARQLLETQSYGKAMYRWMDAVAANRDLLTDVAITEAGVAVDLGAYVGEWSARMAARYDCTIYAFEPSPGLAAKAAERVAAHPKVSVFPYGVGAVDDELQLSRDGPGSTLYGGRAEFGTVKVRIRDVVTVLDELGLDAIDVLKVNIEGSEYDVLDRLAQAQWLPRIATVSVQFHEWHPDAYRRRRRVREALARTHDQVWSYGWVWELWVARAEAPGRRAAT